jgi:hypothetical protein
MATVYLGRDTEDRIIAHTDRNGWFASTHWRRDNLGRLTLDGARRMLEDLGPDYDVEAEVRRQCEVVEKKVREHHKLRGIVQAAIVKAECEEIADTHIEGCRCGWCVKAGYADPMPKATGTV